MTDDKNPIAYLTRILNELSTPMRNMTEGAEATVKCLREARNEPTPELVAIVRESGPALIAAVRQLMHQNVDLLAALTAIQKLVEQIDALPTPAPPRRDLMN